MPMRFRSSPRSAAVILALLLAASLAAPPAHAARRRVARADILILVNGESPLSVAIGEYFRSKRNVPMGNVVTLTVPINDPALGDVADESLSRFSYEINIRNPVESFLTSNGLVDQISTVVVVKGVPHTIGGACTLDPFYLRDCTRSSVDSELAILFSGLDGSPGIEGMANPYFGSDLSFVTWRTQNPGAALKYLVARLDGYQTPIDGATGIPVDVKNLIDAPFVTSLGSTFVIDEDPLKAGGSLQAGNQGMLEPTAANLAESLDLPGTSVVHDQTTAVVSNVADIGGFASWGSNDASNVGAPFYGSIGGNDYPGSFGGRALATDLVSSNARTFTSPASYGQSLLADLIQLGAAGLAGNVQEPTLTGVIRPHLWFRYYTQGVAAAEAHWRSVPYLGWMNVYVGDPLLRTVVATATSDRDGDGVADGSDVCSDLPDPTQLDTNGDGFGNVCDGDVDDDGEVTTSWGVVFPPSQRGDLEEIALTIQAAGYDPDQDLDGDGDVDVADLGLAELQLFHPPGP